MTDQLKEFDDLDTAGHLIKSITFFVFLIPLLFLFNYHTDIITVQSFGINW